jgi:hypothetical protein
VIIPRKTAATPILIALYLFGASSLLARAASQPQRPAPLPDPVFNTTVAEIQAAYWYNEAAADERMTGKRVRMTGQMDRLKRLVSDVGPFSTTTYGLVLKTSQQPPLMYIPVIFEFSDAARKRLATLTTREILTLEGDCVGRREKATGEEFILCTASKIIEEEPLKK